LEELEVRARLEYVSPLAVALIHTGLGNKDRAFEWLEKAYQDRDTIFINYLRDPQLDGLRSDPRFQNLLARLQLSP
jgi:hypothetical protein